MKNFGKIKEAAKEAIVKSEIRGINLKDKKAVFEQVFFDMVKDLRGEEVPHA